MNIASSSETFWGGQIEPAATDLNSPIWTAEFLSSALAGAGMGTWQLDMETGLVTWDAITSGIFGLEEVAVTTGALLPVHKDDQAALWASLASCRDTGRPHDMIFRGLHADGGIRWLHARGNPFPAGAAHPRYIAGVVSDITGRKLADEAREENERQLRSVIHNLPGIAYRCETSAPWRMTFVSDAVAGLTGHEAADFLSGTVTWDSLIVPEDRQAVNDEVAHAVAERGQFQLRYRIGCPSGEVRWVQERGAAVYSDEGEPLFLEGFVGDINDQATAEQKLRETEERFRLAALATQDVIWDWDLVKNKISRGIAMAEGRGYESQDLGTDCEWWLTRVHPDDRERVSEQNVQVLSGATDRFIAEYRFQQEDGSYADILDRGYLIRDENGQPLRMVGAMLDNTERNASSRALGERESQLRNIFGQALVGIMEATADGRPTLVNSRFCQILGRSAEELALCEIADYTHPDDLTWNLPLLEEKAVDGAPFQIEKRYIRPDGSIVWCNVSVSFVQGQSGEVESAIIVAEDISDKKRAEAELRASELLYRSVLEASTDCIAIIGLDGRLELMNTPGVRAMEIESFAAVGGDWVDLWPADSRKLAQTALIDAAVGKPARFSVFRPTAKGAPKWWDVVVSPMFDENGSVTKLLSISRDITVQRNVAAEVKWASEHDPLTGLANRRGFEAHLQAATIRAMHSNTTVGLLLLDLDHFKHVNDTLGHAAGDHLLSVFGKRLKQCVKGRDFVARLGGDEFAVILEGGEGRIDLPTAGKSILQRLQEPIRYDGRVMSARASIGGAIFPQDAKSANELFNNADTALYALKESGRGGTRMFHQHMREQAQLVSSQLSLARSAITQNSVEPHYQQKIDLRTGRITGFEALLRWRHPRRGIQHPETVAEAFKDYELASRIGDLMQRRVFSDMRRWLDRNLPIGFVAINAAPVEFLRDDFAERLLARMQEQGIPPQFIEIEVTEHVFIERGSDFVGRALKMLSRAGVRIALDDFGTGYSSLSHLRDYPVDVVKIDRSFIDKVTTDDEVRAIVCAVIDLAKSLNIEVVAEGVETEAQKQLLIDQRCELGQGYLFGRAIEADEVPILLQPGTRQKRPLPVS
jgi:diguanylate cyclase (GGDEF)-like protein/PAS domain S-box-containing protein